MARRSGCSPSSTSIRGNAWRSRLLVVSAPTMCSTCLPTCSPSGNPRITSDPIMARSSPRMQSETWLGRIGVKTLFIEPGSPWENGFNEVVQWETPGRASQWRNLLHAEGGPSAHRTLETPLQHDQATQQPRLQATGTTHVATGKARSGFLYTGATAKSGLPSSTRSNLRSGIARGGRSAASSTSRCSCVWARTNGGWRSRIPTPAFGREVMPWARDWT